VPVRVRQQKNRLFGVIHEPVGQTRLIVGDESNDIFAGDVFGGDDHEFVPGDSGAKCNFPNLAARNLAAHGRTVKHVGKRHIVDVLRLPRDFVSSLFARDGYSNDAFTCHRV